MYAGIDVGGTKTLVAVFNGQGKLLESLKFATPSTYPEFTTELAKTVAKLSTKKFTAAATAIPGKVDRRRGVGIAFGNLPWTDIPIEADVEKILNCPSYIENDANLAGLSEALAVKAKYHKVLYITVSTGIGGVLVINGVIDPNTQDAEIGHILLEHRGKLVRWQEFASGKAIVARFGKRASEIEDPAAWYVIARNIAIGLIDLLAVYTPDAVIIGGGVGTHFKKFEDRLLEELKIYENPMVSVPPIMGAANAEEAVIYGCYELIQQRRKAVT